MYEGRSRLFRTGEARQDSPVQPGLDDLVACPPITLYNLPALTCFTIVGDTVERFFSSLGIQAMGGVPMGIMTHYLVGPWFGASFVMHFLYGVLLGAIVSRGLRLANSASPSGFWRA